MVSKEVLDLFTNPSHIIDFITRSKTLSKWERSDFINLHSYNIILKLLFDIICISYLYKQHK
jgi:hypothetical protein